MLRLAVALVGLVSTPMAFTERITFRTADGVSIVGDLHEVDSDAPTVICLPMYRSDRSAWKTMVEPLRQAGLNVLALDLRGHGESGPDFRDRVEGRDADVFNSMWQDVEGAVSFLADRGFDSTRIALVGASVGCSVAVQSVARNRGPYRAVVLLTPGVHYLGVDTLDDAKRWPGIPLWILTSKEEESRVQLVAAAFKKWGDSTHYEVLPGTAMHGTRMFGKADGIEKRIAGELKRVLAPAASLRIPHFVKDDERVQTEGFIKETLRVPREIDERTYTLLAFAVGDTVTLGAMFKGERFSGAVHFRVGKAKIELPFATDAAASNPIAATVTGRTEVEVSGQKASFRGTTWINIELDRKTWFSGSEEQIGLEFREGKRTVRIPGGSGAFTAKLVRME